jgi:hypothetical protein
MKNTDGAKTRFCRHRAWRLAMPAGRKPLTLCILGLVAVVIIANSGCNGMSPGPVIPSPVPYTPIPVTRARSPTTTVTPTRTATPTHTSIPTLTPTSSPTATPSPTLSYTPSPTSTLASATTPIVYPAPELIGVDIIGCTVILKWNWPWQLTESEYFAVRAGIGAPGHSIVWLKDQAFTFALSKPGEYVWEVAICRGDPATHFCEELAVSEQGVFRFLGCASKDPGPDRP